MTLAHELAALPPSAPPWNVAPAANERFNLSPASVGLEGGKRQEWRTGKSKHAACMVSSMGGWRTIAASGLALLWS